MSLLSKLVGGAAVEPIEAVGNVITGIFGDKGEKLSHEQIMARLAQAPARAQGLLIFVMHRQKTHPRSLIPSTSRLARPAPARPRALSLACWATSCTAQPQAPKR